MAGRILDGRKRADEIAGILKKEVAGLEVSSGQAPVLAVLQIGRSAAACAYLESQKRVSGFIGLGYKPIILSAGEKEDKVISIIEGLNSDNNVTAILVHLPLPKGLNLNRIRYSILALKDAEGLNPQNLGRLFFKDYRVIPPTPAAVMELIGLSGVKLYGKEAVIIGHSDIVGKPLAIMLLNEFTTVSVCHIATSQKGDIESHIKRADILVVAVGRPNIVKGLSIKKGAVVVDVGINMAGGRIVGDVEFERARKRASYISPVPGGVGPLTTVMLIRNCISLFKMQRGLT